ncbi:MAG: NAD(+)/NADH kinase [Pseudomonadota bacterium]
MKLRRVLVVFKKSSYTVYARERRDPTFIRLLKEKDALIRRFLPSHGAHAESLRIVRDVLTCRGIRAKYVNRATPFSDRGMDLVVTVGGDGTFLEASHSVLRAPILGVNSSPKDSVGIFCGAIAEEFQETLDRIEAGRMPYVALSRFFVRLNGRRAGVPVANEVLIAHRNPANTTRYFIRQRTKEEQHKSSGVWIATAVGSTAAIGSAGGRILPLRSSSVQYLVREPYSPPGRHPRIRGGIVAPGGKFSLRSKMRAGVIFLDGSHLTLPFPMGTRLEIDVSAPRLKVFGFSERRWRRFL